MLSKYFSSIIVSFLILTLATRAQNKMDFSFFSTIGYIDKNNDFLLKSDSNWNNRFSNIGGELTFRGGEFGQTQYEMSLRYVTSSSNPNAAKFTLRQLYTQIPLTDYLFFTIGKREMEFGVAEFQNSSNKLSPKERLLGHIERLERQAPVLFQLDWITSSNISLGAFSWSNASEKWEDSNIGMQVEFQFDNFYNGLYFYYENMKFWSIGINISQQLYRFRIYGEGILKEKNEQFYAQLLNFTNKGKQFSFTSGLVYEWNYFSTRIEHIHRTEGFTGNEKMKIKELVINTGDLGGYNKSYFGKNYLGLSIGTSRFFISNLNFNITNLLSIDDLGGEVGLNISFIHKESVIFGGSLVYYYGKEESEYRLYLSNKFQTVISISTSF